jgi:transcriptional regulator with XRE-family HTH domain
MTTPFGEALRRLREERGVTQKAMALALGVTPAYLSALEHGKRGRPTFAFVQRVTGYFHIIWDEAEELFRLADVSDPRVTVDTAGLAPGHTAFANALARRIRSLPDDVIEDMARILEKAQTQR